MKKFIETTKTPLTCRAISISIFLDPLGNVFPCTIFSKKLGNIRDNDYDLNKILNSTYAQLLKNDINQSKCPQCWTPCESNQSIMRNLFKCLM
jgi:radical SAM protein with 4Fe4S-binding SPASM domain